MRSQETRSNVRFSVKVGVAAAGFIGTAALVGAIAIHRESDEKPFEFPQDATCAQMEDEIISHYEDGEEFMVIEDGRFKAAVILISGYPKPNLGIEATEANSIGTLASEAQYFEEEYLKPERDKTKIPLVVVYSAPPLDITPTPNPSTGLSPIIPSINLGEDQYRTGCARESTENE